VFGDAFWNVEEWPRSECGSLLHRLGLPLIGELTRPLTNFRRCAGIRCCHSPRKQHRGGSFPFTVILAKAGIHFDLGSRPENAQKNPLNHDNRIRVREDDGIVPGAECAGSYTDLPQFGHCIVRPLACPHPCDSKTMCPGLDGFVVDCGRSMISRPVAICFFMLLKSGCENCFHSVTSTSASASRRGRGGFISSIKAVSGSIWAVMLSYLAHGDGSKAFCMSHQRSIKPSINHQAGRVADIVPSRA